MKINQLKWGVALSYISMGIGNIISIVYTPVMLRILGQSEYGLYNLVFSIVSYIGLLSFGFSSAYIRFNSRFKDECNKEKLYRLNGMFLCIFFIIGIIAMLAGFFLLINIEQIFGKGLTYSELRVSKVLMSFMIFNIAISFPASIFETNITANEQYIFQRVLSILKVVINPLITLPLLLCGYKSISLVIATTLITVISIGINVWFCFKKLHMKFIFNNYDINIFKEIAIFSGFIFINMITDQISWNVDKFIIGVYQGTIGVAIYSIGSQINTYYMSFSISVSSVFIPRINSMVTEGIDNSSLTDLFTRIGRIQFIVLSFILSGFIFFGEKFINIWAGEEYSSAYIITLILVIPVTIPLIQTIGLEIIRAKNMHKFRSIVYFFIAIGNMLLSIPLCRAFGGIGSAVGTGLALLIGNGIIMNIYYHKVIGLNIKYFWREIIKVFPALIIPGVFGTITMITMDFTNISIYILTGLLYCAIFTCSMWFLGMNSMEKESVSFPITKLLGRLMEKSVD